MQRLFVVIAASVCLAALPPYRRVIFPLTGTAVAQPADAEKQAFEAAKELGTVEAWDAFLANYPTGFHADLARAYVKKLAGAAPPPAPAPAPASPPKTCPLRTRSHADKRRSSARNFRKNRQKSTSSMNPTRR